MEPKSIEELFERWRTQGDVDALAAVFDRTAGELYPLAHLLGRDEAEAEDLLQETFLAAIERSASWDKQLPLRPWLVGILSIAARRQRRARARKPEPEFYC